MIVKCWARLQRAEIDPGPPASPAEPDLVNEFLRKIANQKAQISSEEENEKEPRFDINACAGDLAQQSLIGQL